MIRRFFGLVRRISVRQLIRNPRAELGRILAWFSRRLERVATVTSHGQPEIPAWLQEEMIALASVEPGLLSDNGAPDQYRHYGIPFITKPGEIYRQLVSEVGERQYTHVMILPWLVRGGADRGALYHLDVWAESMPASDILVLLTEGGESAWAHRVPKGVKVVEFGKIVGSMGMEGQVQLMTRLLVQLKPGVVHNINSRTAWESMRMFGLALRQRSRLYASLFCDDHDQNMVPVGYARRYLRSCYPHLAQVFCDNSVYPVRWSREIGVPRAVFTVMKFPYDREVVEKVDSFDLPAPPRILWAGRFDRQKRPDVLLAIAQAMPDVMFDVHGVSVLGPRHPAMEQLGALQNVTLHGPFVRFEEIVRSDHAAYLFTSSWEGLPTILLDAAAAGLPVVAPAVGGVVDLIERDWLVDDPDDVDAHVQRLRTLVSEPQLRRSRRADQYRALSTGRSWVDFKNAIGSIEGYARNAEA
ncbi:glycosyltransferase [Stenotrophomonas sp. SRS1]|uniref:glycosyltransferase n=1 Tax=Stenotrophomonas sp. SRS1 TaxID=2870345 RepID=UPI00223826E1|nr:glycosyltransferase [Stenotrophomonas sp. SRS1]MCW6029175.1 glycosyltransferase [Stenotrophomonas sp. SRS1]